MTPAIWSALFAAAGLLIGQWATGRLFARLKAIEDRQEAMDRHCEATDRRVELINAEGSKRHDEIQVQYWQMKERITIIETISSARAAKAGLL